MVKTLGSSTMVATDILLMVLDGEIRPISVELEDDLD